MGKNRSPGHMCFFVLYHGFLSNESMPSFLEIALGEWPTIPQMQILAHALKKSSQTF